jgi:hypothetical protein
MRKMVRAGAGIFDKQELEPQKNGPAPQRCYHKDPWNILHCYWYLYIYVIVTRAWYRYPWVYRGGREPVRCRVPGGEGGPPLHPHPRGQSHLCRRRPAGARALRRSVQCRAARSESGNGNCLRCWSQSDECLLV